MGIELLLHNLPINTIQELKYWLLVIVYGEMYGLEQISFSFLHIHYVKSIIPQSLKKDKHLSYPELIIYSIFRFYI